MKIKLVDEADFTTARATYSGLIKFVLQMAGGAIVAMLEVRGAQEPPAFVVL